MRSKWKLKRESVNLLKIGDNYRKDGSTMAEYNADNNHNNLEQ